MLSSSTVVVRSVADCHRQGSAYSCSCELLSAVSFCWWSVWAPTSHRTVQRVVCDVQCSQLVLSDLKGKRHLLGGMHSQCSVLVKGDSGGIYSYAFSSFARPPVCLVDCNNQRDTVVLWPSTALCCHPETCLFWYIGALALAVSPCLLATNAWVTAL